MYAIRVHPGGIAHIAAADPEEMDSSFAMTGPHLLAAIAVHVKYVDVA